ncbi:hypothetical protein OESDEN_19939, partial [Oesophagostomum dentatum]
AQPQKAEPVTVARQKELSEEIQQCYARVDLSFRNTKEAFKSKTNFDLLRAFVVLRLCAVESLVKHNQKILRVLRAVLGKTLFKKVLKSSFYGQFVAGEDTKEIEPVVEKLKKYGVKSILDYSVESDLSSEEATQAAQKSKTAAEVSPAIIAKRMRQAYTPLPAEESFGAFFCRTALKGVDSKKVQDTRQQYAVHDQFADRRKGVVGARTYFYEGEQVCDHNRDIFMETVDAVAKATHGEGFAAIKATALGRPALLLKLSECIAQTHNFFRTLTGTEKIQFSRLSAGELVQKLQEFGIKTDSAEVRDWFKSVDFDGDGYVDFHGWSKILDNNAKLGNMFQILNIKTGNLEPLIQNLTDDEEQEVDYYF